jgi:hypothetical protein
MSVSGEDMAKFMMAHLNDGNYQHSKDAEIFSVRSAGGFHTHLRITIVRLSSVASRMVAAGRANQLKSGDTGLHYLCSMAKSLEPAGI